MAVFKLFLVRHAMTESNKNLTIQGHLDEPLNEIGRQQAGHLAKNLYNENFTQVFSSDLSRARETAEIVLKNSNNNQNVPITFDQRIRERNYGEIEGKSIKLRQKLAVEQNVPILEYTPPGGETLGQHGQRVKQFFQDLCQNLLNHTYNTKKIDNSNMQILVVTHGGTIREIVRHFYDGFNMQISTRGQENREMLFRLCPNTGLSKFLVSIENMQTISINCLLLYSKQHLIDKGQEVNHVTDSV